MGLDKWLKPEEETNKRSREKKDKEITLKKVSKPQKETKDIKAQESVDTKKLSKFELICSNRKCKYRKTIMKKLLTEKDKTCPRCSSVMKIKKLN